MTNVHVDDSKVRLALAKLEELIGDANEPLDAAYFSGHSKRYQRCVGRVSALCPPGARLLDIGSHFLHQAGLFELLGFDVIGFDVAEFSGLDFVRQRAQQLDIENLCVASLERGYLLGREKEESIDCVLFAEILEHITFNPSNFWRQVHRLRGSAE